MYWTLQPAVIFLNHAEAPEVLVNNHNNLNMISLCLLNQNVIILDCFVTILRNKNTVKQLQLQQMP